jgi:hypothetical protein
MQVCPAFSSNNIIFRRVDPETFCAAIVRRNGNQLSRINALSAI